MAKIKLTLRERPQSHACVSLAGTICKNVCLPTVSTCSSLPEVSWASAPCFACAGWTCQRVNIPRKRPLVVEAVDEGSSPFSASGLECGGNRGASLHCTQQAWAPVSHSDNWFKKTLLIGFILPLLTPPIFPRTTSRINYLYVNPCLRKGLFPGDPT